MQRPDNLAAASGADAGATVLAVQAIARELKRRGVRHVFGIPGKESVRLGVELEALGITFCSARHETQAVMMADGYWRASGELGIALLAQGAGFANAVSGLACAAKARSGVVAISGDLLMSYSDPDDPRARSLQSLKGIDPRIVCEGIAIKYVRPGSATLMADIRATLDEAEAGKAISLVIPSDLFSKPVAEEAPVRASKAAGHLPPREPDPDEVTAVADLLGEEWAVSRPIVLAGRGAVKSGALPLLRQLAERTGALLATTLMARSAFRGDAYSIGVCGTFATPVAGDLLRTADCILAFGASLNPFTTYGKSIFSTRAHVIQIDSDETALGKHLEPELAINADARLFAERLLAELERRGHAASGFRTPDVAREIAAYDPRSEFNDQSGDGFIDPRTLMVRLNELLPGERMLVIDAGLHLHYACTFLEVERPQDFIFPLDTLAVGLAMGAAIGAAAARPQSTTVLEIGDCGLMMSLGDLETAVRHKLPLVVVVSNDQAWGAEAQHLQMLGLSDTYVRMKTPSFASLAAAMGAEGHTITSPTDLETIAPRLRERPSGPIVLDCRVHPAIQPVSFNFDYAGVFAK
jgi:thiamine pyrophosphate-dependent acetolactate synthase large subunit-like protein